MLATITSLGALLVPNPGADPLGFFQAVFSAITSANPKLVAALIVLGLVFAVRKWGAKLVPALASGKAAVIASLLLGGAYAVSAAFVDGVFPATFSGIVALLLEGMMLSFTASGVFSQVKTLKTPSVEIAGPVA